LIKNKLVFPYNLFFLDFFLFFAFLFRDKNLEEDEVAFTAEIREKPAQPQHDMHADEDRCSRAEAQE